METYALGDLELQPGQCLFRHTGNQRHGATEPRVSSPPFLNAMENADCDRNAYRHTGATTCTRRRSLMALPAPPRKHKCAASIVGFVNFATRPCPM